MGPLAIAMIVLSALGIAGSVGTNIFQNVSNKQAVEDTNQKNLQSVQATNAANTEQAELAYKRSLPENQVKNLVDAGMSKAGAIQTLTGGGTYQAPVLQSASEQAPQMDLSGISSAFERLGNIPSNVEQMQLVEQNKQLVLDEAKRKQELHEMEKQRIQQQIRHEQNAEIRRQYGFDAVRMTDKLGAKLYDLAAEYGVSWNDITSQEDLVKKLKLNDEPLWTNAPESAREAAVQNARNNAAENRANTAAYDSHELANYRKAIERINVKYYDKEKQEQLLNLMRVGQGLIEDNNIKFQDRTSKELENYVREAGIDNEAEARALAEYVRKLQNEDALDVASKAVNYPQGMKTFRAGLRLFLSDLGEILSKVSLAR